MSANRTWLWALLVLVVGGTLWYRGEVMPKSNADQLELTRVMFVTGGSDDFWKLTVRGAEAAAKDHNAELKVKTPDQGEGSVQQLQILIELMNDDLDGCAVSPLDAEGQTRVLNRLAEKMDVVTFDSDAPLSNRKFYVGTSNYLAGKICHDLVSEALPEGGEVAVFISNLTKNNMKERKSGYEETLEKKIASAGEGANAPTWETVEFMIDEGDTEKTKENIRQAIKDHEDLACIVGMNGYHGPIMLEVLKEEGKLDQIKIVAFDEAEETLAGVADGTIYATIAQDPYKYGYEAVRMLTSLHNGKTGELPIVGGGTINVNCQPIRKADVAEFKERLKQRLVEDAPNTDKK